MRLAVKLSLSTEHSRAFNNRTCENVVRIPKSSRCVRLRKLLRWSVESCSSAIRFIDVLRERLSHISGQEQGYFRKILQPIDSIEHHLLFGLFFALQ